MYQVFPPGRDEMRFSSLVAVGTTGVQARQSNPYPYLSSCRGRASRMEYLFGRESFTRRLTPPLSTIMTQLDGCVINLLVSPRALVRSTSRMLLPMLVGFFGPQSFARRPRYALV